ncbi:hypothetical protein HJA76_30645 [Rhizobium bangladeshense]|uniref:hypothetical protein n=1 Tax=Rhizobium bangladeshense TaxID=1138189 RepID=UPI001C83BE11|nr:hypothetical protein [Rhizobium bangladeshense]MBX4923974.1 hypothetical protein [Rhizobium bangladeshense]
MSEHHHSSSPGFRCDAAMVIGLALACVRQGSEGSPSVPVPVMAQLDALADRGDPACRMVRNWIRGRRTGSRSRTAGLTRHRSSDYSATAEINSGMIAGEVL